jgi:NADH dehydrogenase (ubiquinone) Fe-S protein 1
MDAIGSNIRVDSRGLEVLRVQPRLNEEINEEWISDKTRYACDGLKRQRLTQPMAKVDGKLVPVTWREALKRVAERLQSVKGSEVSAVAGPMADAETLVALKDLLTRFGSENFHLDGANIGGAPVHGADIRTNYIMNSRIPGPEEADVLLLVGAYPKKEGPILNARIRKSYLHNGLEIGLVGEAAESTFQYDHVGIDVNSLDSLLTGQHPFTKKLSSSKKPMIIIGSGVVDHPDAARVFSQLDKLVKKVPNLLTKEWNGINVLQRVSCQVLVVILIN